MYSKIRLHTAQFQNFLINSISNLIRTACAPKDSARLTPTKKDTRYRKTSKLRTRRVGLRGPEGSGGSEFHFGWSWVMDCVGPAACVHNSSGETAFILSTRAWCGKPLPSRKTFGSRREVWEWKRENSSLSLQHFLTWLWRAASWRATVYVAEQKIMKLQFMKLQFEKWQITELQITTMKLSLKLQSKGTSRKDCILDRWFLTLVASGLLER